MNEKDIAATFRAQELHRRQIRAGILHNMAKLAGEALPESDIEGKAIMQAAEWAEKAVQQRIADAKFKAYHDGREFGYHDGQDATRIRWSRLSLLRRLIHTFKGTLP